MRSLDPVVRATLRSCPYRGGAGDQAFPLATRNEPAEACRHSAALATPKRCSQPHAACELRAVQRKVTVTLPQPL